MRHGRDLAHVEDRNRRLDHGPDLDLVVGAEVHQAVGKVLQGARLRDLGNENDVRARIVDHVDVGEPMLGVEAVDADRDLPRPEAAGLDRRPHLLARIRLGLGRDRILKVHDDGIGRQRAGLFDGAFVVSRHIESATARTE